MKKGSMLTALLLAMVMCFSGFAVAESMSVVDDLVLTSDEQANTGTEVTGFTLANYQQQQEAMAMYSAMVATTTLKDFYDQLASAYYADEAVRALFTVEWTNALYAHADELYALEDPADEDAYNLYEEVSALIAWVFGADDARTFDNVSPNQDYTFVGGESIVKTTVNQTVTWTLTNGTAATVWIDGPIVINNGATLTIEGAGIMRRGSNHTGRELFNIHSGAKLIIKGNSADAIIINGDHESGCTKVEGAKLGSMIRSDSNLELTNVKLINNWVTGYVRDHTVTTTDDTADNFAGGAITLADGTNTTTIIKNCTFENNQGTAGGAIYVTRAGTGTITIEDTTFKDCIATSAKVGNAYAGGGAIFVDGRPSTGDTLTKYADYTISLYNVTIDGCDSEGCGSAIYLHDRGEARVTMTNCTVTNCVSSASSCGTIRCDGNGSYQLTVDNCHIYNNTSKGHGGGIYWNALGKGAELKVTNGTIIEGNTASSMGGGLFVEGSKMDVTDTIIRNNTANMGGGIGIKTFADSAYKDDSSVAGRSFNLTLGAGVEIVNNTALTKGGGISYDITSGVPASGFVFNYTNAGAIISNNKVSNDEGATYTGVGGGIAIINDMATNAETFDYPEYKANTRIESGEISNNQATDGAGIHIDIGSFTMTGGTIENHTTTGNGAGVYLANGDFEITGGEIKDNTATAGAGAYVTGGSFKVGGTAKMQGNVATAYGGAAYVNDGDVTMNGGTIGSNENANSARYGGGVYVNDGDFVMTSGSISHNTATEDGGAVYVTGGTVKVGVDKCSSHSHPVLSGNEAKNGGAIAVAGATATPIMYCGEMSDNMATASGGAVYVTNGGFTMNHGEMKENSAINGGAVYVNGGAFTMLSGTLEENTALTNDMAAAEAGTKGYGGAVFAEGGNIVVGVEKCLQDVPCDLHKSGSYYHPIMTYNEAVFGGALAVRGGEVILYCCNVTDNKANNNGTGMNIFMDSGSTDDGIVYHYYDGAVIGEDTNHGIVSIGGELNIVKGGEVIKLQIVYNSNYSVTHIWEGQAPDDYYVNLPYCPTEWREDQEPNNLTFVGWTKEALDTKPSAVRRKDQYMDIGYPQLMDEADATLVDDQYQLNFYAVWAPLTNPIAYAYSIENGPITEWKSDADFVKGNAPASYQYRTFEEDLNIPVPVKFGYKFNGWKMYATNKTVSNWDADPARGWDVTITVADLKDPSPWTGKTNKNFGDIVLVAMFEPEFAKLTINKGFGAGVTPDDSLTYIFHVTGTPLSKAYEPVDMYVTIQGYGSTTLAELPVGNYVVTEMNDWSWRYTDQTAKEAAVMNPAAATVVNFTNSLDDEKKQWLDDEDGIRNDFGSGEVRYFE